MSKIQYLHYCPTAFSFGTDRHYNVILEDGTQYNICSNNNKPEIIKCIELLHICISLFDIKPDYEECGFIPDWVLFPDHSYVCVDISLDYYHVDNGVTFSTSDLYELLDYLKKLYPNLVLPIKIGISH